MHPWHEIGGTKRSKVSVTYVRNDGRGQLSSEWRHNDNSWLWIYGDWRHVATGCTALVSVMWFASTNDNWITAGLTCRRGVNVSLNAFPSRPVWTSSELWFNINIVWRIRGKIIRTVLCCVVYDSCTQWYAHTWAEQFLKIRVCLLLFFITSKDSIKVKRKKDIYNQSHTRQQV